MKGVDDIVEAKPDRVIEKLLPIQFPSVGLPTGVNQPASGGGALRGREDKMIANVLRVGNRQGIQFDELARRRFEIEKRASQRKLVGR